MSDKVVIPRVEKKRFFGSQRYSNACWYAKESFYKNVVGIGLAAGFIGFIGEAMVC